MTTSPSATSAPSRRLGAGVPARWLRRLTGPTLALGVALAGALPATPTIEWEATPSPASDVDVEVTSTELEVPATAADEAPREEPHTQRRGAPDASTNSDEQIVRTVAEVAREDVAEFSVLGVTWDQGSAPDDLVVQARTRTAEGWSTWDEIDVEDAIDPATDPEGTRGGTAPTFVGEGADGVAVRLRSAQGAPEGVELALLDGGTGLAAEPGGELQASLASAGVQRPAWRTRKQWGVNRSSESTCSSPTTASAAKGVTLHHTAGANGYSRDAAPGIVRAIHRYHTAQLGWCDIGYNFLVDTYGTIYVGRRGGPMKQVRGAHAGNYEANTYFTGVSMMGNFENARLTPALKDSVRRLIAWRIDQFDLDPQGTVTVGGKRINVIHGHRDIALAGVRPATYTACPGRYGVAWLNQGLRTEVAGLIADADDSDEDQRPSPDPEPEPAERMSGSDRYATAAAVSEETFPEGADTVLLASGADFPDALAGGPAAGRADAPVLLAGGRGGLPAPTLAELERLDPQQVYVVGGPNGVSETAITEAGQVADSVERLSGTDRYATAAAVTRTLWESAEHVYVASGTQFPDALAGGALAAHQDAPLLLTDTAELPEVVAEELARLDPERITVLGGYSALDESAAIQVGQAVPTADVRRIRGEDRYETAALLAEKGWDSADEVLIASGIGFADALAGVPAVAQRGTPLLLAQQDCRPASVADMVEQLGAESEVLLGGTTALSDWVPGSRC